MSSVSDSSRVSGTDFSIERILSDEPRAARSLEDEDPPSWLCCTRYKPPKLPRSSGGSASRGRRAGRHARVPFSAAQAAALEAAYARAPYLAPPALRALAAALNLRDDRIKIWFQNRRARERREKSHGIITPPHAVPLPPTALSQYELLGHNTREQNVPHRPMIFTGRPSISNFANQPTSSTAEVTTVTSVMDSSIFESEVSREMPDFNDRSQSPVLDVETV